MKRSRLDTGSFLERLDHPAVDVWLPPNATRDLSPVDVQRMRIISAFLQALVVLALTFGTLDAASGLYPLAATSFASLPLAALTLWRMRRGAPTVELAFTSTATLYLVLVLNASLNGGLESPALYLLPLVPTLPLLMNVPRLAFAWVVICSLTAGIAFTLENPLGMPFATAMAAEDLPLNRTLVIIATCIIVYAAFWLNTVFGRWMQARLLEAEADRLDRILDAAGDAILRLDTTSVVSTANAAALRLFEAPQLEGVPMVELLPDLHRLDHAAGAVVLEARSGGSSIPVEATCTYFGDGRVLVIRDIRERVQAQAELQCALDEAEAASLAKSRFLASMSHELRTPLNAVIGYAEMVGEDIDAGTPPEDSQDLDHIVGSARHLLALIDQVLDLAKVEAGRMEVERRNVPLLSFLDELETVGRTLAKTHSNRWRVTLPTTPVVVSLDEVRVRQIVLNLLSNAAKFCENGELAFEVQYVDERLSMTVSDTGIGMSPSELAAVWEEFVQADLSTHRNYGGTGLGLPLARRLTTLLEGTLEAKSTPGVGTSFTIELPVPTLG